MKLYLTGFSMLMMSALGAQPKLISQAIVTSTTNVIAPEEEENPGNAGSGGMNFRNMLDGEIKSTTWLKNDMVKTVMKSDMGRSTIIRNNTTKLTTTLMEIMGTKTGFFVSDSEQTELRKKADSLNQNRRKKDSSVSVPEKLPEPQIEIVETGESKKIAGYVCKKAFLITSKLPGINDTVLVWYTPEIKLQNVASTGGLSAFGRMGSVNGLDKFDGFVMRYGMNMRRNRRMEVEVTRIETNKEVADKEFDIPKDFEIKPLREMQNMFGGRGGFQMPKSN